jgi:uncharacterized membrane-anchored protein YitT (DUF2179 family)
MEVQMKSLARQIDVKSIKQVLWNLFLLTIGSILCAIAVNGILIPNKFLSAGLTGIVLMIHYHIPSLSVAWLYFLLNVPIFAIGWKYVGRRFFLYSMAGMVILSGAIALVKVTIPVHDMILSALLAGIIFGVGMGITLRSLGSGGGTDILAVALFKQFSIRLGSTTLAFNCGVLMLAAWLISLESAIYTLIYIYVSARILNLVVSGLSQRKAVYIISPEWKEISRHIMQDIHRGVTILDGHGGYSGQNENALYTVISFHELSRLKQLIRKIDSKAFVVVNDTLEVMGYRIGNQPQW